MSDSASPAAAAPAAPAVPVLDLSSKVGSSTQANPPQSAIGKLFESASRVDNSTAAPVAVEAPAPAAAATPVAVEAPAPGAPVENPVASEPVKESRSAKDFKLVKEARDAAIRERETLKNEVSQYQSRLKEFEDKLKNAVPMDYEDVKKANETLQQQLERIAVEKSQKFQGMFDIPLTDAVTKIKTAVAGVEGINIDELTEIITNPNAKDRTDKLNEVLSQLTPIQQGRVTTQITKIEEIIEQRGAALENHKGFMAETEKRAMIHKQEQERAFNQTFTTVLDQAKTVVPYLQHIEGNTEHNARVDSAIQEATKYWNEPQSPEVVAQLTLGGVLAPQIYQHAQALHKENQALQKELQSLKSAAGPVRAGASANAPATKASIFDQFKSAAGHTA